MNSLSWNIRGIDALGRKKCITDTLAKSHASIIAFQETKKESFSASYLDSISASRNFVWNSLPAKGTAGGILVGVDSDLFEIIAWDIKDFSVSCILKNKVDSRVWRHISVYGSPYEEGKEEFLSELHTLFLDNNLPTLVSGDFNLVRFQEDKSNGVVNQKWCDKFNAWIEIWGLIEVRMSNRKFTWSNNQVDPILATIDRIFCKTELDAIFPLSSSQAYTRLGSDHTPILWDSGVNHCHRPVSYKFKKWWFLREDFKELVTKSWQAPTKGKTTLDRWQEKIRRFRKTSKGWSRNIKADLRKLKKDMMEEFDLLDIKSESEALSEAELARLKEINLEMKKLWLKEETKAKQHSRDKDILEGDRNTAYFHAVANQRRRKTLISSLEGPEGQTSDLSEMLDIASD
jgi:exonuclease III